MGLSIAWKGSSHACSLQHSEATPGACLDTQAGELLRANVRHVPLAL